MSNEAVIFGYSGHAYVVIEMLLARHFKIAAYYDNEEKIKNPYRLEYWGLDRDDIVFEQLNGLNAFVTIGNNKVRRAIFEKLIQHCVTCPAITHDRSFVSASAQIGQGSIVMPAAVINAMTKVGDAVICNSSSVIEHECVIGDYAHIGPGAVLAGNVVVGKGTFVGANSVIRQGIKIGSNVIIGAGSVVTKDIGDGLTVYGNPAKVK